MPNLNARDGGVHGSRSDWEQTLSILEEELIYTDDPDPITAVIDRISYNMVYTERTENRGSMTFMEEYTLPLSEDEFGLIEDILRFQEGIDN
jgi:hypothetical protein